MKTDLHTEIQELDVVVLLVDLPEAGLARGDMGTVLLCEVPGSILVEFSPGIDGLLRIVDVATENVVKLRFSEEVLIKV